MAQMEELREQCSLEKEQSCLHERELARKSVCLFICGVCESTRSICTRMVYSSVHVRILCRNSSLMQMKKCVKNWKMLIYIQNHFRTK